MSIARTRTALVTTCAALLVAACSSTPSTTTESGTTTTTGAPSASPALKPIDRAALKAVVEKATKEMLVPGAVVAIRTPQGSYTVTVGTTELGKQTPPDMNTHFRIASNSKTMTAALDRAARPGRQAQVQRPGVRLRSRCTQRCQHHRRRAVENAQRALQLHECAGVLRRTGR